MGSLDELRAVAERDGLTIDQVRVLIELWAYPIGPAIWPVYEKAVANHPHWQAWITEQRATVPSLTEWQTKVAKEQVNNVSR